MPTPQPKWEETEEIVPTWEDTQPVEDSMSENIAKKGMGVIGAIGKGLDTISSYTSAPIRAGIYAAQTGDPILESMKKNFGEDPSTAPTGEMIAAKLGLSQDKYIKTPLIKDPWGKTQEERNINLSPADIGGGVISAATDPLTYVGEIGAAKYMEPALAKTSKLLSKYGASLKETAGKRASKAALGSNIAAQREMVGMTKGGTPNTEAIQARYRDIADRLLTKGEEVTPKGEPIGKTVGWVAKTEDVGNKASDKFDFWKKKYNKFTEIAGKDKPVSGEKIADELMGYAESLPVTETNKAIKERLYREAENMMSANKDMSLDDALRLKSSFQFNRQSPDAFTSSADVNNKIRNIIDNQIENSLDTAIAAKNPGRDVLQEYKDMKKGYGLYKNISSVANERMVRDVSNRLVSPTDYMAGIGGVSSASNIKDATFLGIAAAAANKIGREYGSSMGANLSYKLSKAAEAGSQSVLKYAPALKAALQIGIPTYIAAIEALKNKDPEFKRAVSE